MTRITDEYGSTLREDWIALRGRFIELRDREVSTRAAFARWHTDALALFVDLKDDIIEPMRDGILDLIELRAVLERQHEAESVGDAGEIIRAWKNTKTIVQNGRGLTTKLRIWVAAHQNDPDWAAKLLARIDEAEGV